MNNDSLNHNRNIIARNSRKYFQRKNKGMFIIGGEKRDLRLFQTKCPAMDSRNLIFTANVKLVKVRSGNQNFVRLNKNQHFGNILTIESVY
jgi:hypothetical protein